MKFLKRGIVASLYAFVSIIIILLVTGLESTKVDINPIFLTTFNILFTGLIPIIVAFIAMHSYLKNHLDNALMFGCGMLAFGLGSISTGILIYLNQTNNVLVTVYNICALLGSVNLLFAAVQYERTDQHPKTKTDTWLKAGLFFGSICLIVLTINYMAVQGLIPPFVDINGFTSLRYIVLSTAIDFYLVAALLFWRQYRRLKHIEHYWYALALSMISLGLFGVMVASGVGTLLGWVGRIAQYIGTVYAAISMISMYAKAENANAMVNEIMMDFFADGEARYRNLIEASPDSIISIDEDYRIFIANTSANMLLGKTPNPVMHTSFLDYLEQPFKDEVQGDLDAYRKTGSSTLIGHTKEMVARDSAGRILPVEISFAGQARQSKFAVSLIIRDVTKRKRLENALKESELQARSLVAELEEASKNKTQFISVMSHELRNPLAAIVLGLNLMDMSKNIEQTTKAKRIMERQVSHLCKLVDDLLDLTRITQNKIILKIERIDLNEIALSAIGDMKPQYEKKGIMLEFETKAAPLILSCDPLRISQVMINLLANCLKFTHEGGSVRLLLDQNNDEAIIVVKDNGVGMSQENIKNLFKPFVQFENSLDRSNGGLGLGLSIVKGIVELHGGQVSAFSEGLDQGSAFSVCLPISGQGPESVGKGDQNGQ